MSATRFTLAALTACLTVAAAHAASIGLDVKTGLWEMTSTGKTKGKPVSMLPAEALEHLTPGQRAMINSAMSKGMKHVEERRVSKQCVTEKTLKRGIKLDDKPGKGCKETLVSNTAKVMEMRLHCSGSPRGDGNYRFEAVSREEVRGTMTMKVSSDRNSITIKRTMSGRWLGPDCGNVKPK